jgi:hypothetical protein
MLGLIPVGVSRLTFIVKTMIRAFAPYGLFFTPVSVVTRRGSNIVALAGRNDKVKKVCSLSVFIDFFEPGGVLSGLALTRC